MAERLIQNRDLREFEHFSRRSTDVVIVGGSLSGLVLSRELNSRGVDHVVVEACKIDKSPSIHYLTSPAIAERLGLLTNYREAAEKRKPITGYRRLDGNADGLVSLEEIPASERRTGGFITFSLAEIRVWLGNKTNVLDGRSVNGLVKEYDTWKVTTSKGDEIRAKAIIDATGSRARVLSRLLGDEKIAREIENRTVRACFGGVYAYDGPEDTLLFVDRFPPVDEQTPKEGAGWIMPLGDRRAEVVVGWETKLKDVSKWHSARLNTLIATYIEWFNIRGIKIDYSSREEVISGSFSQGLINYSCIPHREGIVAFGESLGLNRPLNGYLIRDIMDYAKIMAGEVTNYLKSGSWDPHKALVRGSSVNFGMQVVLSKRKIEATRSGVGRSSATRDLQRFLVAVIGEDGLWEAIDGGMPLKNLVKGLIQKPRGAKILVRLGLDYLRLLAEEDVYRREIAEKLCSIIHQKH